MRAATGSRGRPNAVIDPATGKTVLGPFRLEGRRAQPSRCRTPRRLRSDIGLSNPDLSRRLRRLHEARAAMPGHAERRASPQFENVEVPSPLTRLIDRFVSEAVSPGVAHGIRKAWRKAALCSWPRAVRPAIAPASICPAVGALPARPDRALQRPAAARHGRWPRRPCHATATPRARNGAPRRSGGIGAALRTEDVSLLHDGRAQTVLEASSLA